MLSAHSDAFANFVTIQIGKENAKFQYSWGSKTFQTMCSRMCGWIDLQQFLKKKTINVIVALFGIYCNLMYFCPSFNFLVDLKGILKQVQKLPASCPHFFSSCYVENPKTITHFLIKNFCLIWSFAIDSDIKKKLTKTALCFLLTSGGDLSKCCEQMLVNPSHCLTFFTWKRHCFF